MEQVYADPNPFPPLSAELVVMIFLPVGGVFVAIRILMRVFRRTGRHRKGRVPRPRSCTSMAILVWKPNRNIMAKKNRANR